MKLKSFLLAAICAVVQYYDYHLFGFLAAKISKHFFAANDPVVQLLKTYMIMFMAVLAKPIGALILGRIGDIYGRFATVIISLTGTAVASLLISITPSYEKIGIFSAIILLFARMGVAGLVSSGTDGVRIYIFEKIGASKQCLGNGMITFSTQMGSFLAALSAWFFSLDFMPDYSWRIAFMLGTVMGIVVIIIRMKYIIENDKDNKTDPDFDYYKEKTTFKIVSQNLRIFIPCLILAGCIGSTYQFIIIFFGIYNFEILKLVDHSTMQFYTSAGVITYMIFAVIGGLCADFFGKIIIANIAGGFLVFLASVFSFFLARGSFSLSLYLFISIFLPFITMPALAFLKQSIPAVIRYRVFSLAHAFGSIVVSAPTAYISTYFYYKTKISWIPMAYFIVTILLMLGTINFLNYHSKNNTSYKP